MNKSKFTPVILLFLTFFCSRIEAQYTLIPDPNFELFLENNGMGDGVTGNGQVLTANIENVTELDAGQAGINDFTGIEDFVSLEFFNGSYNPITSIDLSLNINLKILGLAFTALTTLELSNNLNLEHLVTFGSPISSMIIGNKPNLKIAEIYENQLTTIDLSQCPVLETLYIQGNFLTELDISQNPELETLWCHINELQALDTSQNPELAVLFTGHVNISHYDFSQNPNLYFFSGGYNNALTYVDFRNGNNEIVELFAIVQSFNLECIYVDDTSAPYLDDWYIDTEFHFVHNEVECNALNTEEVFAQRMTVFPNPVRDILYILNQNSAITAITISDVSGKIIDQINTPEKQIKIDFSSYPKGIYFVQAESEKKIFRTEKVVKN
ncbi:MAG: T9SS type A sorting domain-containing protein [Weeksellaceae bacterium]